MSHSFLIALVGRPNVGKSRMFNRLTASQRAIVHDFEGVTRDRQYAEGEWYGRFFTVIDTGGFVVEDAEPMLVQMRQQAQLAIEEADIILFMMDGRQGLTGDDQDIAAQLRATDKPVFFIVNKLDTPGQQEELVAEFYQLGEALHPLSAEHGLGLDALMDQVAELIPRATEEELLREDPFAKLAFVGKPNAGKSSLINALLGKERLLTSDVAGTTRDSVDTMLTFDDREYLLIDTAGLRRKSHVAQQLERYSVIQAIRSLDRADIAVLVIDCSQELSAQDKKIASVIISRGRGCVVVANKWDLVNEKESTTAERMRAFFYDETVFLKWAPIVFTTAIQKKNVHRILQKVDEAFEQYTRRIPTSELNRFLEEAISANPPPTRKNRKVRFYYASQVATRPPAFVFKVNYPEAIDRSYKRYLENRLREAYGFEGTPVRMMFRARRREDWEW